MVNGTTYYYDGSEWLELLGWQGGTFPYIIHRALKDLGLAKQGPTGPSMPISQGGHG